jgi:RNA polymerase sigma factor (sigma-70 family)
VSEAALPLGASQPRAVGMRFLGDDRLARLAARGSSPAFAEIYKRYHQPLYRYCLSIVRNPDDASDALQSTAAKALQALSGEMREIALKPWLYRIAHNESISLLRRRRNHASMEDAEELAIAPADADLETREQLRELVSDMGELTERQRGTLIMRELSGLEYDQIADAFDISPSAAKQTVYEARTALHERAEGREMDCSEIQMRLSEGDRRVARGRRIRAHIRDCGRCAEFESMLRERPAQLAAMAPPLPAAAAAAILKGVLGGGGGAAGGGGLIAALTGGAATEASTKAMAIGAAAVVAGAGVIGAVSGKLPGLDSAKGEARAADSAALSPPGAAAAHAADRRRSERRSRSVAQKRERRAAARERGAYGRTRGGGAGAGTQGNSMRGDNVPLPPAGQHVRSGPRVTSGAPEAVDRPGRRITRLGDTIQGVVGDTVPVPELPDVPVGVP